MKPKLTLYPFLILAGSSLLAISSSHAQSGNWAADADGNWSLDTNWSSSPAIPGTLAGDIIGLNNDITDARTVTIDTTSRTAGTLNIGDSNNSHAFTLAASGGGTLTLDNSGAGATLAETGSIADSISSPIVLNDNFAATIGGALGISAAISETSGPRTLTKSGGGTLTLSGANSFTGAIAVTGGVLAFSGDASVASANPLGQSAADATNLVLGNGTTLRYTGAAASSDRSFTIDGTAANHGAALDASGSGAITFTSTAALAYGTTAQTRKLTLTGTHTGGNTLAADLVNNGGAVVSIAKTGAGTWVLSGTNSHGAAGINPTYTNTGGGTLIFAQPAAIGIGTGVFRVDGGTATYRIQSDADYNRSNGIQVYGNNSICNFQVDRQTEGSGAGLNYQFSNGTAGAFDFGHSTTTNFSAGPNITSGTPTLTFNNGLRSQSNSNAAPVTINASGVNLRVNGLTVGGTSKTRNWHLGGTSTGSEIYGAISNAGGSSTTTITKNGTGTWTLSGANTYNSTTTITGGTLKLGANNVLPNTTNVTIGTATLDADTRTDTAGTLNATGASSVINLGIGAALAFANSSGVTAGVWAGTLNITGTFVPGDGTDPGVGVNPGSLRFGVDHTGLSAAQLAVISVNGSGLNTASLDAFGYLVIGGGGPSPYDTWAVSKGLTGASGSATDPAKDADPDNDGRSNLSEFAFNGDPLSGSDNGKIFALTEDSDFVGDPTSAKELILTVAVRTGTPVFAGSPSPSAVLAADNITYSIEGSLDLASFPTMVNVVSPIDTGLPAAGAGYEYRSFSLEGSDGLTGKGFLRAKVTSP